MSSDYIDPAAGKAREANAARVGAEGVLGHEKTATARYKFSEDGGAIGAHDLARDPLPSGAILTGARVDVITPPTSAGAATIALSLEGAGDLQAAAPIGGVPWADAEVTPLAGTNVIKTTAPRRITATIGAFALTAGEFVVYLDYEDTRT
jgi:hypothetical protein